jgi:hypothetical protein
MCNIRNASIAFNPKAFKGEVFARPQHRWEANIKIGLKTQCPKEWTLKLSHDTV